MELPVRFFAEKRINQVLLEEEQSPPSLSRYRGFVSESIFTIKKPALTALVFLKSDRLL